MNITSLIDQALVAGRKARYAYAAKNPRQALDLSDTARYPHVSDAEVEHMAASIAPALYRISCYDVMGSSTQVVVVEENSPLTIPFIAAQETQVSTCFVWSSERRRYTGVLSMTEYVKVLLFCEANPQDVETVSNLSVKRWLELKRSQAGPSSSPPEALVSATADENLAVCIERMLTHKVRRLAVIADDGDVGFETSILAVLTYDVLVQHVASRLFSTNVFGASGASSGVSSPSLPPCVQSIVNGGGDSSQEGYAEGSALECAVGSATGAYRSIFDIPYARLSRLGKAAQYKARHGHYPSPAVVGANTPIAHALRMLIEGGLHAVAVVDDVTTRGPIVDMVTRHDTIRMESGGVFNLQVPVREALAQAVSSCAGAGGGVGVRPAVPVFFETDTLQDIIELFATRRVPVIFLVDPNTDAILSQLSINEVFSFLSERGSA